MSDTTNKAGVVLSLQPNADFTAYEIPASIRKVNRHNEALVEARPIHNIIIFNEGKELVSTGTGYLSPTDQFQASDILDDLELYLRRSPTSGEPDTALMTRQSFYREGTLYLYIKDARKFELLPSKIIRSTDYEIISGVSFSIKCEIDGEYKTHTIPSNTSISEFTELGKLVRARQVDLETILGFTLTYKQYQSMIDNTDNILYHFEELEKVLTEARK